MSDVATNRVVLVTGGTGALGRAVVRRFVADSANVHTTWFDQREVNELKVILGNAADAVSFHQADVTSEASVHRLFATVGEEDGPVEILANIVGGFVFASLDETDGGMWDRMISMNATSAFLCARAAVPGMRASGWGRIINVASGPAINRGAANMSAYSASKAAVMNLTESLAKELIGDGITVNAIVPSIIDTEANREAMPGADTSSWLSPDEIAQVVAFLASQSAGIVTGTAMNLTTG